MEYFFSLVLTCITLFCVLGWKKSFNRFPYPPGPRPHPLIGNFLQFPKGKPLADYPEQLPDCVATYTVSPWITYAEWKKTHGDVVSVGAFGNRIVIVNSAKAAWEIFEKRGEIYSDRPYNVMAQDLIGNPGIAFLSYTKTFRLQRKLFIAALNPTAVADYAYIQEKEAYALLARLIDSPNKYYKHVRRTAGAIILMIAYGHPVETDDDYFVQLAEAVVKHLRDSLQPDSFLVNLIPALKHIPAWMPFTGFHRFARMVRQLDKNLHDVPFSMVKSQMCNGVAPLSYTSRLLNAKGSTTAMNNEEEEDSIKSDLFIASNGLSRKLKLAEATAASLYGAGADTTVSSIVTFILAMVLYPEVQRKAQAEIDAVVGGSRLPMLTDKSSLPYLECVLSEVFRWQPVSALGIPHAARRDDIYEGYFIPKGAVIISNIWAMVNDEEMYPDPMKFWPERFDGRFPMVKDPRLFVFGFGRRVCPGRHLANNSIFITIACLLSTYNFTKARDHDGKEIEPCIDYSQGPPMPFECQITPRSPEAVALIKATQVANEM